MIHLPRYFQWGIGPVYSLLWPSTKILHRPERGKCLIQRGFYPTPMSDIRVGVPCPSPMPSTCRSSALGPFALLRGITYFHGPKPIKYRFTGSPSHSSRAAEIHKRLHGSDSIDTTRGSSKPHPSAYRSGSTAHGTSVRLSSWLWLRHLCITEELRFAPHGVQMDQP